MPPIGKPKDDQNQTADDQTSKTDIADAKPDLSPKGQLLAMSDAEFGETLLAYGVEVPEGAVREQAVNMVLLKAGYSEEAMTGEGKVKAAVEARTAANKAAAENKAADEQKAADDKKAAEKKAEDKRLADAADAKAEEDRKRAEEKAEREAKTGPTIVVMAPRAFSIHQTPVDNKPVPEVKFVRGRNVVSASLKGHWYLKAVGCEIVDE